MSPKRFLILAAVAALTACSFAQSVDTGSLPPEELILGTSIPDKLLDRHDVQEDLGLTTEQKLKFYDAEAQVQAQVQVQSMVEGAQADPNADTPAQPVQPSFDALRKRMIEQVDKILTPSQMKRLKQIALQLNGYAALTHAEVQRALDIPKETVIRIEELATTEHRADSAVFDKYEDGDITADKIPEIVRKNRSVLNAEIGKLLTQGQKDQFKAMCGKPFKGATSI